MSFLCIDIGNTRLKWAIYDRAEPGADLVAHGAVFLERVDELAERQWAGLAQQVGASWSQPTRMLGCVVASEAIRVRACEQLEFWDLSPRWVVPGRHEAGVSNGYDHPSRLGADRWVALIGARHRLRQQGLDHPAVVVMVGTCVTIDALDAQGHFLGGVVLPGFGLMQKALELGTAGLKVPTGRVVEFPTNTSDALMSGGTYALAGAIEGQLRRLQQRLHQAPVLIMAGGAAVRLHEAVDWPHVIVDTLIFEGLLAIEAHKTAVQQGLVSAMPPPVPAPAQMPLAPPASAASAAPVPAPAAPSVQDIKPGLGPVLGPDAIHF